MLAIEVMILAAAQVPSRLLVASRGDEACLSQVVVPAGVDRFKVETKPLFCIRKPKGSPDIDYVWPQDGQAVGSLASLAVYYQPYDRQAQGQSGTYLHRIGKAVEGPLLPTINVRQMHFSMDGQWLYVLGSELESVSDSLWVLNTRSRRRYRLLSSVHVRGTWSRFDRFVESGSNVLYQNDFGGPVYRLDGKRSPRRFSGMVPYSFRYGLALLKHGENVEVVDYSIKHDRFDYGKRHCSVRFGDVSNVGFWPGGQVSMYRLDTAESGVGMILDVANNRFAGFDGRLPGQLYISRCHFDGPGRLLRQSRGWQEYFLPPSAIVPIPSEFYPTVQEGQVKRGRRRNFDQMFD